MSTNPTPGGSAVVTHEARRVKRFANGRVYSPARARVRASLMTEMAIRGVSQQDIGAHFGVSTSRVKVIQKWAETNGIVEEVRERMMHESLTLASNVYKEILSASPESLADPLVHKGHALKLKAAKEVADGMGAFRKQAANDTAKSQEMDLNGLLALRRANLEDTARDLDGQLPRDAHAPSVPAIAQGPVDGVLAAAEPDGHGDDDRGGGTGADECSAEAIDGESAHTGGA